MSDMETTPEDPMPSFEDKLRYVINTTHVGITLALAKDVGIWQILTSYNNAPLTSEDIAERNNSKERYVREILDCLVTAGVVRTVPDQAGPLWYYINKKDRQVFKSSKKALMSFPVAMMKGYDLLKQCFDIEKPGGLDYTPFQECDFEFFNCNVVKYAEDIYMFISDFMQQLEAGTEVTELSCRDDQFMLAGTYTNSSSVAKAYKPLMDFLSAKPYRRSDMQFEHFDLRDPKSVSSKKYDWVYCMNVIHKLSCPTVALDNVKKLLKPNGMFLMIEKVARGTPIESPGDMELARMYAHSVFFCVPECLYRDPTCDPVGPCWEINSAIEMIKASGFDVRDDNLGDEIMFLCRLINPE